MASAHLKGEARFTYTPAGGVLTTHLLAVPLLRNPGWAFASTRRRRRWGAWNADYTQREVFALGTAVDEIAALVRMENQPAALRTMLRVALEEDATLTYKLTAVGTEYPCKLLGVEGGTAEEIILHPDRDRFALGEWEVGIVLRRVDGGTLEGLLS